MTYFTGDLISDGCIMLEFLRSIPIESGTNRKKLCKSGGSALYGSTWMGFLKKDKDGNKVMRPADPAHKGRFLTKLKVEFPELMDVFNEYRDRHFKDFDFTDVMINKNYPIGRHRDGANVGESYLVTFGEYEGGLTRVWWKEDWYNDLYSLDNPIKFNGSKFYHEALPSTGERYALVFFSVGLQARK